MSGGGRRREEGGWALSTKVFLAYLDQEGGGEVEGDEKRNRDTVGKREKSKAQERGEREALLRHGGSMTMESSCTLYHALRVDTDASPHFPVGRVMY